MMRREPDCAVAPFFLLLSEDAVLEGPDVGRQMAQYAP